MQIRQVWEHRPLLLGIWHYSKYRRCLHRRQQAFEVFQIYRRQPSGRECLYSTGPRGRWRQTIWHAARIEY